MALGLLAGIGLAAPAIQRGIDDQRARELREEEVAYQREQRENARADRSFGLGQRQRLLDQQGREDEYLRGMNNVPQTREVDVRNFDQRQITVDDEGTPSAAALPATKAAPMPDYGKLKYQAEVARKAGKLDQAQLFEEASNKALFADSARKFQGLAASAQGMSLAQLARAAADIYNQDPLPAQVQDIQPTANGGVKVFFRNESGDETAGEFRDKRQLLSQLEAYYSPATYAAVRQKQQELRDKAREKASEPIKTAPGERVSRVNPDTDQAEELFVNSTPTAAQVRAAGQGAGAPGGKDKGPFATLDDAWKDTMASGESKFGSPEQASRARELSRLIYSDAARKGQPIDPQIAISLASGVALGTKTPVVYFSPQDGQFVRGVEHADAASPGGARYKLQDLGAPSKRGTNPKVDDKQAEVAAAEFLASMPEDHRRRMLAASIEQSVGRQLYAEMETNMRSQRAVDALGARLGRPAAKQDIDAEVKKAGEVLQRSLDLIGNYGPPADKAAAKKALLATDLGAPSRPTQGQTASASAPLSALRGLGLGALAATPEQRAQMIQRAKDEQAAADAAAVAAAKQSAILALKSGDRRAAFQVQSSPRFGSLDEETKMAIYRLVNAVR